MTKPLQELLAELDAALRAGSTIDPEDRALLERVHSELELALATPRSSATPHTLRESLRDALDRLQAEHPQLSGLLSRTLDTLSDLGI